MRDRGGDDPLLARGLDRGLEGAQRHDGTGPVVAVDVEEARRGPLDADLGARLHGARDDTLGVDRGCG